MRYIVIGAGAVGGTIGARLHQSGCDVLLVARGAHYEALRERGLRLITPDSDQVLDIPATSLVLLPPETCTKTSACAVYSRGDTIA